MRLVFAFILITGFDLNVLWYLVAIIAWLCSLAYHEHGKIDIKDINYSDRL